MSSTDSNPVGGEGRIVPKFWDAAHMGIIGLSLHPLDEDCVTTQWPTDGYDGHLHACKWRTWEAGGDCVEHEDIFVQSGHTKAEWVELADVMIARWQEWKAEIAGAE